MLKDRGCGDLRATDAGTTVRLAGWVHAHRDHGGVIFVDLRDASGLVQVVCPQVELAHRLRGEWCIAVSGSVRRRPEGTENAKLPTGEVEVVADSLDLLAPAAPLPFQVEGEVDADESIRLRYRYLDLRRAPLQHAMRTRSKAMSAMRRYLEERDFVEVTTPLMARSTPEGARDFLVPSRLQPGSFYALTQSPQLFKEILMVAGLERYYQFAICLRDEDLRADRQPEHMQLDLEMSFCEGRDVQDVLEGVMAAAWRACLGLELPRPFARMSFADAMDRFGSDKPDLRAGPEIVDLSGVFAGTGFKAFAGVLDGGGAIRGLRVPGAGDGASRAFLDGLIERAKELGAAGLVWMVVEPGELRAPIAKFLSEQELQGIRDHLEAQPGDLVLLVAGDSRMASEVLGTLRVELARSQGRIRTASDPADWQFVWIVDFPLFEPGDDGGWEPAHNIFCAPTPDTEHLVETDPGKCVSQQYDLTCNGLELASGSVRIHRADLQEKVFEVIGLDAEQSRERFGFLLEAFKYGPPPHAGFGMGLDRVIMMLVGGTSIRDVIAFPKTQTGSDLMTGAPSPVASEVLRELGVRLAERKL